jgi:hypothetical protein
MRDFLTDSEMNGYCNLYGILPIAGWVTLPGRYWYSGRYQQVDAGWRRVR